MLRLGLLLVGFRCLEFLHGFPRWPFPTGERGVVGRVAEGAEDRRPARGSPRSARPQGRGALQRLELLLLRVGGRRRRWWLVRLSLLLVWRGRRWGLADDGGLSQGYCGER